jgi:hypothetical protein
MIDTNKYEGHTEGKWVMAEYKGRPSIHAVDNAETPTWVRSIARGLNPSQTADHALLLDAPLLLAEVIQLSKIIDFAWEVMDDQTAVEFNDLIKGLELESQWESEGILMGYCLGCSIPYPLEDMNKQRLCQECQEEVIE